MRGIDVSQVEALFEALLNVVLGRSLAALVSVCLTWGVSHC